MNFYYLIFIILFTNLLGCTATMVNYPGQTKASKYGPVNEQYRLGLIKYLNAGADSVINARRENAYKQMHSACSGKYRIINEGTHSEGGAIIPIGNMAYFAENQYLYISFECINHSKN